MGSRARNLRHGFLLLYSCADWCPAQRLSGIGLNFHANTKGEECQFSVPDLFTRGTYDAEKSSASPSFLWRTPADIKSKQPLFGTENLAIIEQSSGLMAHCAQPKPVKASNDEIAMWGTFFLHDYLLGFFQSRHDPTCIGAFFE